MTQATKYQLEQEALENAFVRQLLIKYNIKEVTTQRQAINGTREFEFPVSSLAPKTRYGRVNPNSFPKLRMACFKTGYVRKQNGCYSPYQVNKTYNQNKRHTYLTKDGLVTTEYIGKARALIYLSLIHISEPTRP